MAMGFSVGFAEDFFTIDGTSALHIRCTADEPATAAVHYSFDLTLKSTYGAYTQSWAGLQLPQGQATLTVPFVPPLAWAQDFAVNLGEPAYPTACGLFQVSMVVHYTGYAGSLTFTHDYTGYAALLCADVAGDLLPTVGALTVQPADGVVPADWGVWVQGKSVARIAAPNAAGSYGSTILSWRFGPLAPRAQPTADLPLTQSGAVTVPVTVTDSRLRTATADLLLQVEPYAPPTLTGISTQRCTAAGTLSEEGDCFLPVFALNSSPVAGHNPAAVACCWKPVTQTDYGPAAAPQSGVPVAASLQPGVSYDVKLTVSDAFGTADYYSYVSSTVYLLHFLKGGTGIAVGKAAEQPECFDVGLDAVLRRDASVGGDLSVVGSFTLGGTEVSAALRDIGTLTTAALTAQPCLEDVAENTAVKCGRVVLARICGALTNGEDPPWEGETYHIATLPQGFYSPDYPALAVGVQNAKPCKAAVDAEGRVYVVPFADGMADTEVTIAALV